MLSIYYMSIRLLLNDELEGYTLTLPSSEHELEGYTLTLCMPYQFWTALVSI